MKTKKQLWIDAYQDTLQKYVDDEHEEDSSQCKKCIFTVTPKTEVDNWENWDRKYRDCVKCPEFVFGDMGCMYRNNPALNSSHEDCKKDNLIQYHTEAIKFLENRKRFNMKKFRQELKRIDNEIGNGEQ